MSDIFVYWFLVTLVAWFSFRFFRLAHLALQNVNKDYIIFLYFCNFVAKSDKKPKTKYGINSRIGVRFDEHVKKLRNKCPRFWRIFWVHSLHKLCDGLQKVSSFRRIAVTMSKIILYKSCSELSRFIQQN